MYSYIMHRIYYPIQQDNTPLWLEMIDRTARPKGYFFCKQNISS